MKHRARPWGQWACAAVVLMLPNALLAADVKTFVPSDRQVLQLLEPDRKATVKLAQRIFDEAEMGYLESNSSAALQRFLKQRRFKVTAGVSRHSHRLCCQLWQR